MKKLFFLLSMVLSFVSVYAVSNTPFKISDPNVNQDFDDLYKQVDDLSSNSGVTGEYKPGLLSSTSGQMLISQGPGFSPLLQWDGRINGPDISTLTTSTATTAQTALSANTSLTGTHTTLTAGEKVVIFFTGTCQAAAGDNGSLGLKRDTTNITSSGGCNRIIATNAQENSCSCVVGDTPGSIGTFTYTVTFNSGSGGSFQFGEGNRMSTMVIVGFPK